jgi:sortase B
MKSQKKGHSRTVLLAATVIFSIAAVVCAWTFFFPLLQIYQESSSLSSLAKDVGATSTDGISSIDWQTLQQTNSDVVGWLSVSGTSISLPVCKKDEGGSWYLSHDLSGQNSTVGVPFIDDRSSPEGPHTLIYGHHITGTDAAFSSLQSCYEQSAFDSLGDLSWTTPQDGLVSAMPLCSFEVTSDYAEIQDFEFSGDDELRLWLSTMVSQATAISSSADEQCATATRVFTLVTCSSDEAGQPYRTLVLFTA